VDAMTETLTVRFLEHEFYDPLRDRHTLRLQAITGVGTWYADTEAGVKIAPKRRAFQQYVLGKMSLGMRPAEVNMEEVNLG